MVKNFIYFCMFMFYGEVTPLKVFDWKRHYGEADTTTQEFVQVDSSRHQVLHSAVDVGATNHVPSVSFVDFNFTAAKFKEGIMAIRPLMSDGNQLCFISRVDTDWDDALPTLQSRHKMTVVIADLDTVFLKSKLPAKIDPMAIDTVSEFCDVERENIFFLKPTSDISAYNRSLYIQTAFQRFHIGIADEDMPTVFGN